MKTVVFEEETEALKISRVIRDYEYTMASRHFHEGYEIYYLLEGERYYFIDRSVYLVKNDSLVFINRNQVHRTTPVAGSSYHDRMMLQVNGPRLSKFFRQERFSLEKFFAEHSGVLRLNGTQQKQVEKLLYDIVEEAKNKREGFELIAEMRLMELLIYASRCMKKEQTFCPAFPKNEKYIKVQEIADYISEHYRDAGSLEEIAARFFISKSYLSRIFKEVTGFTVNEYLNLRRIMKAKQLLGESSYNVTEISEMLGYENVSYFERVFRKYVNSTPLKFRKTVEEDMKKLKKS